jgi:hypothetical protein
MIGLTKLSAILTNVRDTLMTDQPQMPLNREETRLKMRLSRLLGPHVRVDDESLTDPEFVRAVVERFFECRPQ